jgi:hypothetical protein
VWDDEVLLKVANTFDTAYKAKQNQPKVEAYSYKTFADLKDSKLLSTDANYISALKSMATYKYSDDFEVANFLNNVDPKNSTDVSGLEQAVQNAVLRKASKDIKAGVESVKSDSNNTEGYNKIVSAIQELFGLDSS